MNAITKIKNEMRFGDILDEHKGNKEKSTLHSDIQITLHTTVSMRLWKGRKKTEDKG